VLRNVNTPGAIHFDHNVHDVALQWANIQKRSTHAHDVIYLARMNNAYEGIAHNDHVEIRCGQQGGQFCSRLVRQTQDIRELM
jgi:hypothetical protein